MTTTTTTTTPARPLARPTAGVRPVAPVRIVHLGLGNFFRAHQAWYTEHAPDAADWGIAAFSGRSTRLAAAIEQQDGLYTLTTRSADGDGTEVVAALTRTHAGSDGAAWLEYLADPQVALVTLTVTEAAYLRGPDGGPALGDTDLAGDVAALRQNHRAPVHTVPARLVAGLAARRAAGAGPIALVSCDNLPDNGAVTAGVVRGVAAAVDPVLAGWIEAEVSFVTTMVDRITPATTEADSADTARRTGLIDKAPVVTEPFVEWVLSGRFPAGRPDWEAAGARFVDDVRPFEQRKLWLLNGAHSLLAYAGSARGHTTIDEAVADPTCRSWMTAWWDDAASELSLPTAEVAAYRRALLTRFANPRIRHRLAQIAADGSLKIGVRILPVLRRFRARGELPQGAVLALAAWVDHLRGAGAPVEDAQGERFVALASGELSSAVRRVVSALDEGLASDTLLLDAVVKGCRTAD